MKSLLLFLLVFAVVACDPPVKPSDPSVVKVLMDKQQSAWNQGDIEGFMESYWNSDSLVFIGKKGVTNGWATTLANYKKSYPDQSAMGRLQFDILKNEAIADSSIYTIGKWTLFRTADTLGGHFTLLWKQKNGQWKIVADHTS
ncbi:MAG: DUF4440 domain-containing protein [Bacteroidota bacterium]